jgi:hypothetical protein
MEGLLAVGLRDTDLGEAARKGFRRFHIGREWPAAVGQRRIERHDLRADPAGCAFFADTGVKIVAKGGGEGALIAGLDADLIDRAIAVAEAFEAAGERPGFAVERGGGGFGGGEGALLGGNGFGLRVARDRGGGDARFGGGAGGDGLGLGSLSGKLTLGERRGVGQLRQRLRDAIDLCGGAGELLLRAGEAGLGDPALGLFAGKAGHGLRQRHLGIAAGTLGLGKPCDERGQGGLRVLDARGKRRFFVLQLLDRIDRIERERAFAGLILGHAGELAFELGDAAHQSVALGGETLQLEPGFCGGLARAVGGGSGAGERLDGLLRMSSGAELGFLRDADQSLGRLGVAGGAIGGFGGFAMAGEEGTALGEHDLLAQFGVALGGAGLAAQCPGAHVHFGEDVVEPGEVHRTRLELLLGILAADMQAGNARSLFQHGAALGGLGGDDSGDLALAHQRRTVRAGGGIGEDQRDILGAHVAAIGAIGAARAPLDAADDFHLAVSTQLDGRNDGACRLQCEEAHLGEVTGRARRGAGEDDVVHAAAAHRFGAGLAHHPADRFQKVGLAAAIGADNAGKARLDP